MTNQEHEQYIALQESYAILKSQLEALQQRYALKPISDIAIEPTDGNGWTESYLIYDTVDCEATFTGWYNAITRKMYFDGDPNENTRNIDRCYGWQFMKIPHKEYKG